MQTLTKKKKIWLIVGICVLVLCIGFVAAMLLWKFGVFAPQEEPTLPPQTTQPPTTTAAPTEETTEPEEPGETETPEEPEEYVEAAEEAEEEAQKMLKVYADFAENWMAVPVLQGVKSETERFAGALNTYSIEAMMQDGKALQAGTSHFLGQNFAKSFDVQFLTNENKYEYVWATSWGVSTRLMGALIMTHSDDNGLVLPPNLAPTQVVIVPIFKKQDQLDALMEKLNPLADELKKLGIRVQVDASDNATPGFKFAEYELKGVPLRLAMGGRDLENGTIELARRDTMTKETVSFDGIVETIQSLLKEIQDNIYQKALNFRIENTREVNTWEEFKEEIKKPGFLLCHWDGTAETEEKIKAETKATIRCIPLEGDKTPGNCIYTGKPSSQRVIFAIAY